MKIILLLECSIHEVTYPAGSELEVVDFEGEFLISHHRAKRMEEEESPLRPEYGQVAPPPPNKRNQGNRIKTMQVAKRPDRKYA